MKRSLENLLAAVCLAALPLAAFAQPATDSADVAIDDSAETEKALPVQRESLLVEASLPYLPASNTIASKLPTTLESTPANVGVVTAGVIEEQNARVLGEALENVSGLNVQTGNGVFDFFVVRGFDSLSSGLILTDGAPEPETTFYQLYNAERVEVLKGPGGFLYGSNPLAGAVNIVREQPVPADFGVVGLAVGSHDTNEATFDWNLANDSGTVAFRLNGLFRESDGYRDRLGSEAMAVNPSLTWRPREGTSLNLNLEIANSDYTPDAGLPVLGSSVADVPRERSYHSPFDLSEQQIGRFQVDYETSLTENVTLRNKTFYRELDWETNGTLLGFVLPNAAGGLDVTRSLLLLDDRQTLLGNQLELVVETATGGIRHQILVGVEASRLADDFTLDVGLLPAIDVFAPVETAQGFFLLPQQSQAGDSEADVVAPYVIDQIELSERWQLTLGARFDDIDFSDRVTGTRRDDGELSPMAGVVFTPRTGTSLYASASRAFAPPSARVVGERAPEKSEQVEVGLRQEIFGGRGRATVALFDIERDNIAIPDDNGFTQQAGDQRARGVELEVAGDFGAGIRGAFAYAYTDSELTRFTERLLVGFNPFPVFLTLDRSGNDSAFAPEHLANLWLSKRFGPFTVAGGARYVGSQFIAEDNVAEIDGYLLADLSLAYRTGDWRFSLNLENLFDEEYDTRGFGSFSVIPGAPFEATVGLEYGF